LATNSSKVPIELHFNGKDANERTLVNQLLNTFRAGLPPNKLHAYTFMANIKYLPDIDNNMQKIELIGNSSGFEADIPFFMHLLASPRRDGQQRVIKLCHVDYPWSLLEVEAIKEVKI
jgi:hypothetical protein